MVCWAQSQRLLWIAKQTEPFNRAHLAKAFNISIPQASKDISLFLKNSDAIKYDKRLKVYMPAPKTAEPETTQPETAEAIAVRAIEACIDITRGCPLGLSFKNEIETIRECVDDFLALSIKPDSSAEDCEKPVSENLSLRAALENIMMREEERIAEERKAFPNTPVESSIYIIAKEALAGENKNRNSYGSRQMLDDWMEFAKRQGENNFCKDRESFLAGWMARHVTDKPQSRPAIKKLEWVCWEGGAYAKTPFGKYELALDCGKFGLWFNGDLISDHDQIPEGQAAAEAHYEKTIRGCLE